MSAAVADDVGGEIMVDDTLALIRNVLHMRPTSVATLPALIGLRVEGGFSGVLQGVADDDLKS